MSQCAAVCWCALNTIGDTREFEIKPAGVPGKEKKDEWRAIRGVSQATERRWVERAVGELRPLPAREEHPRGQR